MDDRLHPLGFDRLLAWLLHEQAQSQTFFGVHEDLCAFDLSGGRLATTRFGHRLDTPFGVAAGPHTQLSQNLVVAWLCGARYLELKTVQDLDDLDVSRPCIDMSDEGYNCEWSQELRIEESFAEYADAWTAIRVLQHRAGAYDPDEPGYLCNLSVGYDLAGIRGAKVQRFLDRVAGCRSEVESRLASATRVYPGAAEIIAPTSLADNVTLSTMHGCPPEEVEKIGRYLIAERGLHTVVKLNPTLLGARELRELLNDTLGYTTDVPDDAFAHDLDFATAVDLVRSLSSEAAQAGVGFGVKLTNTLECRNTRGVLPDEMTYMSGRALHPLTVRVAQRLRDTVGDGLDMSLSGGADAGNVADIVACGLGPVTVCSDLLRPGGYLRLRQYGEVLDAALDDAGADDLDTFVQAHDLQAYADRVAADPRYHKSTYGDRSIRIDRALTTFDCIAAPCVHACPAGQDIPEYLFHTAQGDDATALAVVLRDNPLPSITGMVCENPCLERCTRVNYDGAVRIRDVKRYLAHSVDELPAPRVAPSVGRRVAVIGAGPAGLACAFNLAQAGVDVTVYEARNEAGGMVSGVIPSFRIEAADIARDLRRIEAAGVVFRYGERIDDDRFAALRDECDAVFVGVGAQDDRPLRIPGETLEGVEPALAFLARARADEGRRITGDVVVIGGGNSAMDAARTAVRLGGRVRVVYRRTRVEMPADRDELQALETEGIAIDELLAPASIEARGDRLALTCLHMTLGEPDASGRRRPIPDGGRTKTRLVDLIVPAIGQILTWSDLDVSSDHRVVGQPGVFAGGDAAHGPDSIVAAIADGRRAAETMLADFGIDGSAHATPAPRSVSAANRQKRAATIQPPYLPRLDLVPSPRDFKLVVAGFSEAEARAEAARCLDCSQVCDVCVTVCPNRANVAYEVAPMRLALVCVVVEGSAWRTRPDGEFTVDQGPQTAHITDFCNHCGNCTTFCPTAGRPHIDKPRIAASRRSFEADDDVFHFADDALLYRRDGIEVRLEQSEDGLVYTTPEATIELDAATFAVRSVLVGAGPEKPIEIDLRRAATMWVLTRHFSDGPWNLG